MTILLVEDNPSDVFLTKRALKKIEAAYSLVVATDGVEALEFLNLDHGRQLPDLVLLDLKLPKIDGLQVLQQIRANERTRALPVLVVTSSSEESDRARARELGANSYTVKPTDAHEYMQTVRSLVLTWLEK